MCVCVCGENVVLSLNTLNKKSEIAGIFARKEYYSFPAILCKY